MIKRETYAVITGDISNFTTLPDESRSKLIADTEKLILSMVDTLTDAAVFRGDSYQLITNDIRGVLRKAIQLVCWFKLNSERRDRKETFPIKLPGRSMIGTRMSIGVGAISYKGKSVLDSDGAAFHLSGRQYDELGKQEIIRLTTGDKEKDELYDVVLTFINSIVRNWTRSQAEIIFSLLKNTDYTQEQIAKQLNMTQPAVAIGLRSAKWREVEKGINYISKQLAYQY